MKIIKPYQNPYQSVCAEAGEMEIRKSEICNDNPSIEIPKIWLTLLKKKQRSEGAVIQNLQEAEATPFGPPRTA